MTETTLSDLELEGLLNKTLDYDQISDNITCVNRRKTSFLLFAVVPSIPILVNITVLVAVAFDNRRLLRQSRVYAHVSSTLAANVIFAVLGLLQIFSLYFNFEGNYDDPRPGYQAAVKEELVLWWTFRKAFLYGMYIIMCGNIGLLIEAIRSRTCVALRSAAGTIRFRSDKSVRKWQKSSFINSRHLSGRTHDTAVPSSRVAKRRRSYISIVLLWTLSLGYVIAPTVGWSCAFSCTCLSSCFPEEQIHNPPVSGCSRAFPPMSNSWLGVTIGIWAACLLGTFALLRRSVVVLRRAIRKHRPADTDAVFYDVNRDVGSNSTSPVCFTRGNSLSKMNVCDTRLSSSSIEKDEDEASNTHSNTRSLATIPEKLPGQNDNSLTEKNTAGLRSEKNGRRARSTTSTTSFFSGIFGSDQRNLMSKRKHSVTQSLSRSVNVKSSLRYVIWLTVLYAVCTTPPMVYLLADMIFPNVGMSMIVLNVCLCFPYLYCFICPLLLIKCLPGVKRSLVHLVLRFCTYTKTVGRNHSAN